MTVLEAQQWAENEMYERYNAARDIDWMELRYEDNYQAVFELPRAEMSGVHYLVVLKPYKTRPGDWLLDVYERVLGTSSPSEGDVERY